MTKINDNKRLIAWMLVIILTGAMLTACTGTEKKSEDSLSQNADEPHADNDIAMTVRSIIDAMDVDQPLDSAEYNFQGILTDGSGRPLYTDIQGAPGQWSVEVLSPTRARIKNLYLGDLIPEELTQYLLTSLQIPDSLVELQDSPAHLPDSEVAIYDFGGGQLIVESVNAKTESGHRGPLVNILLLKKNTAPIPS